MTPEDIRNFTLAGTSLMVGLGTMLVGSERLMKPRNPRFRRLIDDHGRLIEVCALCGLLIAAIRILSAPTWTNYLSEQGRFTVELPGRPVEVEETQSTPAGPMTMHVVAANTSPALFGVIYYRLNNSGSIAYPSFTIDQLVSEFERHYGSIAESRSIEVAGQPAREVVLAINDEQWARARVVIYRGRPYLIMTIGPRDALDGPDVDRFLDSFRPLP